MVHCNKSVWFDTECKLSKRSLRQHLKHFQRTRCDQDLNTYMDYKGEYKRICRYERLTYRHSVFDKLESSPEHPRQFWQEFRNRFVEHM